MKTSFFLLTGNKGFMNVLAIIQARVGSTRLPNKVLMPLGDKTVLEHVVNRVHKAGSIKDLIVATTTNKEDIEIVKLCSQIGVKHFCGSEEDVLDRFYQACKKTKPDNIVRITADCPIIDPFVIELVVSEHIKRGVDYTSNTLEATYPDGQDVEVFKFSAMEKAWNNSTLMSEREHVTPYINKNPNLFKLYNVINNENLKDKRWTLDNKEDYDFLKKIFENLYLKNNFFGMYDVLTLLKQKPEIENINGSIKRNEGYAKSIKEDKLV